jgi:radical SAM protein with 4Fe4S-binding SPASM domain
VVALDVYLTNACNLRCKFCFNLDREDAPRIALEDICRILEKAYERGNRYVSITGGEPFIYKPIFEVIDFAHGLGYWINILSHGGLLNGDRIRRLKRYWRLRIRISLDGADSATHDALRGTGTFNNSMEKIELLVGGGINVGVGATVSEGNIATVEDIFDLCLERGVAFVRFTPVARVKKGKAAHVTAALHEQLLSSIMNLTLRHRDRIDLPQSQTPDLPIAINALTTRRCMAGKKFFGITPDQKILPCPLLVEHPDIEPIRFDGDRGFDELGRRMDRLFDEMKDRLGGICGSCAFRSVCYGGCLAEKLSFDRDLDSEQPVCTKLILERLSERFDRGDVQILANAWVTQLRSSLEEDDTHACMRHAPFWSVNFKRADAWQNSMMRFRH